LLLFLFPSLLCSSFADFFMLAVFACDTLSLSVGLEL
jgi:hypothetical protein